MYNQCIKVCGLGLKTVTRKLSEGAGEADSWDASPKLFRGSGNEPDTKQKVDLGLIFGIEMLEQTKAHHLPLAYNFRSRSPFHSSPQITDVILYHNSKHTCRCSVCTGACSYSSHFIHLT